MKTVDINQNSGEILNLLDQARNDDVVVCLADGSEFLLVSIDEFDYELAKSRGNQKLMALFESRAKQPTACSLNEVKRRLQL